MTRALLDSSHAAALKPYFDAQRYPLAVYSLLSVMAWRRADGFSVSFEIMDDLLLIAAERGDERHLALPMGARVPDPRELKEIAGRMGFGDYWYVPGEYVAAVGRGAVERDFEIRERPEWGEYTFLAADLAELKGRRLAPKRNLIHQFEKSHVETGRAAAGPLGRADVAECAAFLEEWCKERGCEDAGHQPLECERRAAEEALRDMHDIGAEGVLVRVDGRAVGFGIGYRVTPELGALHFEKAFASIKGLYQYLDRECARRLFLGRFERVTKESDMGMPGLAQSKQSYGPIAMTACCSLSLR